MKVIFHSRDFASVDGSGYGFNHRRPKANPWEYQGRVQHPQWQGTYECAWERDGSRSGRAPEIVWTVRGDARLFGLAAALKSKGYDVDVEPD